MSVSSEITDNLPCVVIRNKNQVVYCYKVNEDSDNEIEFSFQLLSEVGQPYVATMKAILKRWRLKTTVVESTVKPYVYEIVRGEKPLTIYTLTERILV